MISLFFFLVLSPSFLISILLFCVFDLLYFLKVISKKRTVCMCVLAFIGLTFLFLAVSLHTVTAGSLSFNLLNFLTLIIFFNRLNDLLQESFHRQWRGRFVSKFLFSKKCSHQLISCFVDETKLIRNEIHFF